MESKIARATSAKLIHPGKHSQPPQKLNPFVFRLHRYVARSLHRPVAASPMPPVLAHRPRAPLHLRRSHPQPEPSSGAVSVSPGSREVPLAGMTCGGCAAGMKRILENEPQVSAASVNLTSRTSIVWPVSEAQAMPDWQKELGETLAKHLTNCGFKSNP
ncbi:hypothetical protein EUGRSUZ_L00482 [Eucalyptus grandis]|uniref:HMA domain-containing protein n=1 Tax=Eucalyptus grandis TaxID=71139 RepID=A0A058ZXE9_EUCGR|nr:hypothetical protein EUGRSUZ_L00482 [Eucalyptus grandis]